MSQETSGDNVIASAQGQVTSAPDRGKTIGLCLSGGGHRATVFALGVLLYLADAGRHGDIRAVSSVSGGSLTNAYFAVREKPLTAMSTAEVEAAVARLARQIAGSPAWFWITVSGFLLLALLWCSQLASLLPFSPASWLTRTTIVTGWEWQVLYLVLIALWARFAGTRSGGSLYGWWGTWMFLALLVDAVVLAVAVWGSTLAWHWCLLTTFIAILLPSGLNSVAAAAFQATVCEPPPSVTDRRLLKNHPKVPIHAFCATDMLSGRHVFFCHDIVYAYGPRVATPEKLTTGAAVQASAAFPPLFPFRWALLRKQGTACAWLSTEWLVLSDGGVYDNLGMSFFDEAEGRTTELRNWLDIVHSHRSSKVYPVEGILKDGNVSVMQAPPDILIAVNSSVPQPFRHMFPKPFPLNVLCALVKLSGTFYNHLGCQQTRVLWARFLQRRNTGCMVSIADHPKTCAVYLAELEKWPSLMDVYGTPPAVAQPFRSLAQKLCGPQESPDEQEVARVNELRVRDLQFRIERLQAEAATAPKASQQQGRLELEILKLEFERRRFEDTERRRRLDHQTERMHRNLFQLEVQKQCAKVATTLKPLGQEATANLLYHAYQIAMHNANLLLEGFPFIEARQDMRAFQELAAGRVRTRSGQAGIGLSGLDVSPSLKTQKG